MTIPRSSRIAVVDDDDGVRRALARLLRTDGFEPMLFPSGEALLQCDHPEAFRCAILDIRLGGMSGLTLARRLVRAAPRVGIIFMTAADSAATRKQAAQIGCLAYFGKPFDGNEMLEAIRRAPGHGRPPPRGAASSSARGGNHSPHTRTTPRWCRTC